MTPEEQHKVIIDFIGSNEPVSRSAIISLMEGHGIKPPTTHNRLVELREDGVVSTSQVGKTHVYRMMTDTVATNDPTPVGIDLNRMVEDHVRQQVEVVTAQKDAEIERLRARLKRVVEIGEAATDA